MKFIVKKKEAFCPVPGTDGGLAFHHKDGTQTGMFRVSTAQVEVKNVSSLVKDAYYRSNYEEIEKLAAFRVKGNQDIMDLLKSTLAHMNLAESSSVMVLDQATPKWEFNADKNGKIYFFGYMDVAIPKYIGMEDI